MKQTVTLDMSPEEATLQKSRPEAVVLSTNEDRDRLLRELRGGG